MSSDLSSPDKVDRVFVAGELVPGPPLKTRGLDDLVTVLDYTPSHQLFSRYLEQVRNFPAISFETLRPQDLIVIATHAGEYYAFLVNNVSDKKNGPVQGQLFLPPSVQQLLGTDEILDGVEIYESGIPDIRGGYSGRIIKDMELRAMVPLKSLGPLMDKREENLRLALHIPSVRAAQVKSLNELPPEESKRIAENQQSINQVRLIPERNITDWPGRTQGISAEQIDQRLYLAPLVWGLKGNYHINPHSGAISCNGQPMAETTVWEAATTFLEESQKEQPMTDPDFLREMVATLTFWALKLGLKPPQDLLQKISDAGLGFTLPG
jgi:hypothetical protein